MTIVKRLVPAPVWSVALFVLWLALARSTSPGQLLLGLVLALLVPVLTTTLRPVAQVRRPLVIGRYLLTVGHDVVASSLHVAWGVVTWQRRIPRSQFVVIPLDLRDPVGLAVLAMVTTVVPGTIWSELALDRSALMLHVWDVANEPAFIERYKARYEHPLTEIFE